MRSRGLALLIVVGVLGILAVLGSAFVTMAQLERKASLQRLYQTKAVLLARSGLEDALARLSSGQDPAYGGENWDGDSAGQLSSYEASEQVFNPTGVNTAADVETCPVRQAMRPSFFTRSAGNPAVIPVEGRDRGYSGTLSGDRMLDGNTYTLKVEDESAKINVNGGLLDIQDRDGDGTPDHRDPDVRVNPSDPKDTGLGWNFQLARILGVLGNQPELGLPTLGTDVLANRPPGGYASVSQLQAAIGFPGKDLSPYLTVSSWIDAKVVHPDAYASQGGVKAFAEIKKGRTPLALEEGGRPPVNLNAAPVPVLVALFEGLEGVGWQDASFPHIQAITPALAGQIAAAIQARRVTDPFDTWGEFSGFCDALVGGVIALTLTSNVPQANLEMADLLKAAMDPNTRLNKELPDQLVFRWIDKSDLAVWSTEGSLAPTGVYRLGAVGRVLDADGRVLAERAMDCTQEAFTLLRQTTQEDFVGGRTFSKRYLSLASPGHATTGISAPSSWWGVAPPGRGLAVMTYPCHPSALPAEAAAFDGGIALATVEMPPAVSTGTLTFLHHFDDGWAADAGGDPALKPTPTACGMHLQPDSSQSVWPTATSVEPGTLYPDGMHSQAVRSPAYDGPSNFPPVDTTNQTNHAAFAFWAKTHKGSRESVHPNPCEMFFSFMSIQQTMTGPRTQVLLIGRKMREDVWGVCLENQVGLISADFKAEVQRHIEQTKAGVARLPGLRWQLVNVFVDTARNRGAGMDADIRIRSLLQSSLGMSSYDPPAYSVDLDVTASKDLMSGGGYLVLGQRSTMALMGPSGPQPQSYPANTVMDEFAICDFTPDATVAKPRSDAWALDTYQDGRYYKGDDGVFTSVPLQPAPTGDTRLLRVWWTQYLPSEGRAEAGVDTATGLPVPEAPRLIDGTLNNASVAVCLLGSGYSPLNLPLVQGGRIGLSLPAFRYQVSFKTGLAALPGVPALETPFFDDITFAWQPMTGPKVLSWERP